MNTLTRAFILLMLAMMRYEYAIGKSTGRNPEAMGQLCQDITYWQGRLNLLEINHGL